MSKQSSSVVERNLALISEVTSRLMFGKNSDILKLLQSDFCVTIKTNTGSKKHIEISGIKTHVHAAEHFINELDKKAELLAQQEHLLIVKDRQGIAKMPKIRGAHFRRMNHEYAELARGGQQKYYPNNRSLLHRIMTQLKPANESMISASTDFVAASEIPSVPEKTKIKDPEKDANRNATAIKLLDTYFLPRNQSQAISYAAIKDKDVTIAFLAGNAGGGKTFTALRAAIELYNSNQIEEILVFRPRTVTSGESFGAVKGGASEKMAPYIKALARNIEKLTGQPISKLKMIQPLTPDFERGETYDKAVVIVDEAQNLTMEEATLLITRFGKGSKIIINGDISNSQNDLRGKYPGLAHLIATHGAAVLGGNKKLERGSAFIRYTEEDSAARHPLMPEVHRALNNAPAAYKELIATITAAKRDFRLATAIDAATEFARDQLAQVEQLTRNRYVKELVAQYPRLFANESSAPKLIAVNS